MNHPIRTARERAGLTQREIADVLGCDQTRISRIELGVWQARADELLKLADVLGTSVDVLVGRECSASAP